MYAVCACVHVCLVTSVVSDSATPRTAAHQAPPSMGFSRHERWSGVPLPSPKLAYIYAFFINLFLTWLSDVSKEIHLKNYQNRHDFCLREKQYSVFKHLFSWGIITVSEALIHWSNFLFCPSCFPRVYPF